MISLHLLIDLMDPVQAKIEKKMKLNKDWVTFELNKIRQDMTYHADEIASKIRNILKAKYLFQLVLNLLELLNNVLRSRESTGLMHRKKSTFQQNSQRTS